MDQLSRTPPVPWIQQNFWPVHHGDFCRYIGEWQQDQFRDAAPDGDGLKYLLQVIRVPVGIGDPYELWDALRTEFTTVFMFECLICSKQIGIDESY